MKGFPGEEVGSTIREVRRARLCCLWMVESGAVTRSDLEEIHAGCYVENGLSLDRKAVYLIDYSFLCLGLFFPMLIRFLLFFQVFCSNFTSWGRHFLTISQSKSLLSATPLSFSNTLSYFQGIFLSTFDLTSNRLHWPWASHLTSLYLSSSVKSG